MIKFFNEMCFNIYQILTFTQRYSPNIYLHSQYPILHQSLKPQYWSSEKCTFVKMKKKVGEEHAND
jgi:hypothetical protein